MMAAAFSAFSRAARAATTALAAAHRLGVAAGIALAEAALDDLGHELVLVAVQDLDVLVLEAGLEQRVDELLRHLGAVDRGDDRCC